MIKIALIVKVALRARQAKRHVARTGIVGLRGRAVTRVGTEGTVFVRNELWRARAGEVISEGESVLVVGLDGITLKVEAMAAPWQQK